MRTWRPSMRLSSTVRPPNSAMFWNVRATPSAAISLGRLARDVAALEHDAAGVRPVEAGDHVEQRGLAGAVRADDGHDAALGDVDRHVLDRGDAAETLADARNRELYGRSRLDLLGGRREIHTPCPRAAGSAGQSATQGRCDRTAGPSLGRFLPPVRRRPDGLPDEHRPAVLRAC